MMSDLNGYSVRGTTTKPATDAADNKGTTHGIKSTLENTSAHGIPNIVRATSTQKRIVWSLLFITALCFFIGLSGNLIRIYYTWPFNVNVELIFDTTINFPAVTVCNMNPFRLSKVRNVSNELTELFGLENGGTSTGNSSISNGNWDNSKFSSSDPRALKRKLATQIIGNMSYEQRLDIGHDLKDMLLSCSFYGASCSSVNFTRFFNYLYGNCYTFNSGISGAPLRSEEIGPIFGISIALYIEQEEYIPDLQPAAGIRVLIHDQNVMPFPEDSGFTLAPGRQTSIGMTKVSVNQLRHPYTNCTDDFPSSNIFQDRFQHINYSLAACEKSCLYRSINRECACADARYRFNDTIETCDIKGNQCARNVTKRYISREIKCDCSTPCSTNFYKETISESMWPNDAYRPIVLEEIRQVSDDLRGKVQNDSRFIDTNVVKLVVYFSSLEYEHFYQTAQYNVFDLISSLGGQVGLWIGVSVLTVFEFLELLLDVVKLCCSKLTKSGERTVVTESVEMGSSKT